MRIIAGYLISTIGRKQMMALAGLGLSIFVFAHVTGNFLMFAGPEAYNKYGHSVVNNPFVYVAEMGLLAIFVVHTLVGLVLTFLNWKSKPTGYAVRPRGDKATSLVTRTMIGQGIVIFIFVVLHLITFKFGPYYTVTYDGQEVRDLFRLLYEVFQSPVYVTWYVIAVLILGYHLSHGIYSMAQTMGLNHPRLTPKIKFFSVMYGVYIGLGFAIQPIYMMFFYKG